MHTVDLRWLEREIRPDRVFFLWFWLPKPSLKIRTASAIFWIYLARDELRRCVRTRAMCGRTCACACEIHSEKCARCACVRLVFGCAMCDHTFAHFAHKIERKCYFLNYSRTSYPILEHPFLL